MRSGSSSLAAARARRTGEKAPPVSGNRPITSINSQAAFQNFVPPTNVRTHRQMQPPPPPPNQQQYQQQQYQQQQQPQTKVDNGLPFKKLSISDAIGLITLRLGRVEQWFIENEHEHEKASSNTNTLMDNSVLTTIINRLDSIEKNNLNNNNNQSEELIKKLENDMIKYTLEQSKHTEQLFKLNRDLTETKDLLKTFMMKYDAFCQDMRQQFSDYEIALTDLESKIHVDVDVNVVNNDNENVEQNISIDLKELVAIDE